MARDVKIRILGDASDLKRATGDAESAVGGFSEKAKGYGGKIALAVGGAFAVDKLLDFGGEMLNLGGKLDVYEKKTTTVFEGSAGKVREWSDKNNEAFGLSTQELDGLAAGFGDLLKPMGFTADQAAGMSTDVVGLSGALSAWSGGTKSAAEVSETLAKAMLGETDGLKELGISISQDEINSRLARDGKDKLTGAALAQAKAIATQQLVMEKSTDAQKAWSDGSMDGLKNTNSLKSMFEQLKATLAEKLLPVFQGLVSFVVNDLVPGLRSFGDWISEHIPLVVGIGVAILASLVPAFLTWASSAAAAAAATLAAIWPVVAIAAAIGLLVAGIIWAYNNWGWFHDAVSAVASFMTDTLWPIIQKVAGFIADVFVAAVKDLAAFWTEDLWPALKAVGGFLEEHVLPIIQAVAGWLKDQFSGAVKDLAAFWTEVLWPALKIVAGFITGTVIPTLQTIIGKFIEVASWVGTKVGEIVEFVVGIGARIGGFVSTMWDGLTTGISAAKDWIGGRVSDVVGFFSGLPGRIGSAISGLWDGLKDSFRGAINWIVDHWNNFGFTFPTIDVPFIGKVGGWRFDTPNISRLAYGGPVSAGSSYVVGDRGRSEIFTPSTSGYITANTDGRSGGSSGPAIYINVDVGVGTNPAEAGRAIVAALQDYERVNGTVWRN